MEKKILSSKAEKIHPSQINEFFNLLLSDTSATPLCVGQPNFQTPKNIEEAAIQAIREGKTFYTSDNGLPELREALSKYLLDKYQCQYSPDEILMTIGASEAIDLSLRTLLNPDDEVIVFDPVYDAYEPCITLAGGKAIHVRLKESWNYKIDPSDLEKAITPKTKAILLNYPNNPTGAIMAKEDLLPIADICIKHDLFVITDEIYSELTYQGSHFSIASLPHMKEKTFLINGFSKAFAMTGWRLGYLCGPLSLIEEARKIHSYTIVCCSSISQYAALEAIQHSEDLVVYMRKDYDKRRRYAYQRIKDMGLDCFEPEGAFYLFPSIAKFGMDSYTFALRLFKEESLAVIPGSAFGKEGEYHLRISYTCSMEELKIGLDKLQHFIYKISK